MFFFFLVAKILNGEEQVVIAATDKKIMTGGGSSFAGITFPYYTDFVGILSLKITFIDLIVPRCVSPPTKVLNESMHD